MDKQVIILNQIKSGFLSGFFSLEQFQRGLNQVELICVSNKEFMTQEVYNKIIELRELNSQKTCIK